MFFLYVFLQVCHNKTLLLTPDLINELTSSAMNESFWVIHRNTKPFSQAQQSSWEADWILCTKLVKRSFNLYLYEDKIGEHWWEMLFTQQVRPMQMMFDLLAEKMYGHEFL